MAWILDNCMLHQVAKSSFLLIIIPTWMLSSKVTERGQGGTAYSMSVCNICNTIYLETSFLRWCGFDTIKWPSGYNLTKEHTYPEGRTRPIKTVPRHVSHLCDVEKKSHVLWTGYECWEFVSLYRWQFIKAIYQFFEKQEPRVVAWSYISLISSKKKLWVIHWIWFYKDCVLDGCLPASHGSS